MSLLRRILDSKQREIEALRGERRDSRPARAVADTRAALARPPNTALRLIAEVKHKSPSAGELSRALAPAERALSYARTGAAMVSVLCDGPFFGGSWTDLAAVRARLDGDGLASVPVLAKEFVLDEVQLEVARSRGADAVLLIARIVSSSRLAELTRVALALSLEPLVEVVDEMELHSALAGGARVIGVNARDLDTLALDAARAARVLCAIPPDCAAVYLSGLRGPYEVAVVARGRADAALVGEALMRADDPAPLLSAMLGAAAPEN